MQLRTSKKMKKMKNGELGASLRSASDSEMLKNNVDRSSQQAPVDRNWISGLIGGYVGDYVGGYIGGSTALHWYDRRLFAAVCNGKIC